MVFRSLIVCLDEMRISKRRIRINLQVIIYPNRYQRLSRYLHLFSRFCRKAEKHLYDLFMPSKLKEKVSMDSKGEISPTSARVMLPIRLKILG